MIPENLELTPEKPTIELESGQDAARTLFRNSAFLLIADAITKVFGFIFQVYVVRRLGGEQFGLYSTAVAYAGIFSVMADLGMTQYATREIARRRRQVDEIFWDLVVLRILLSTVATVIITISAIMVGYSRQMVIGIFIVCVGFYFYSVLGPIGVVLSGYERIDLASILSTSVQIIFVITGALVLIGGFSFYGLIITSYIGVPVASMIGAHFIRRLRFGTLRFHITPANWWLLLKFSLPFALMTFTLLAAQDIDTVLLSLWRSPQEVGWYKAAYNLIFKLLFIKSVLLSTLTPQLSRYYGVSVGRVTKAFNSAFKIMVMTSLPITIGVTLLSEQIVVWLYTDEYRASGIALAILVWALPALTLSGLCGSVAIASEKEKRAMRVYSSTAILNFLLNVVVVAVWGYVGAAVTTVITETTTLLLFYYMVHSEFPLTDIKNIFVKPIAACLVMGAVILLLDHLPLLIAVAVAGVVYIGVLLALKPFNQSETTIMMSFWGGLRRRLGWSTP